MFKKVFVSLVVVILGFVFAPNTFAAQSGDAAGTLLPGTDISTTECESVMFFVNARLDDYEIQLETAGADGPSQNTFTAPGAYKIVAERKSVLVSSINREVSGTDILGCAIKTGDIKLWMVPFYVRFFLEFVIGIAGIIAVGALVYGGYLYLFAGLSDDKEKGKGAIKNALIGMVLTLVAWAIVNIVIAIVT